jgi:hypothetical protein
MTLPDFHELFAPYTTHGATLDGTRKWLVKKAGELGIPESTVDQVIAETMLELAQGKTFLHPCPCCNLTDIHTTIEHYMRDRMVEMHNTAHRTMLEVLQEYLNQAIANHVERMKPPEPEPEPEPLPEPEPEPVPPPPPPAPYQPPPTRWDRFMTWLYWTPDEL